MANPTTNFNWQMPTSTDLVTDLPADFETFGQAVDTTFVDLKGGTSGQILSKASGTDMDFTWVNQSTDPVFVGARVYNSADLTISNTTGTAVAFNSENFDSDGFHSTSTNTSRLTVPTGKGGYYQISGLIRWKNISAANTVRQLRFYKNGTQQVVYALQWVQNDDGYQAYTDLLSLSAGDYIEIYVWHNAGASTDVLANSSFSLVKVGS